jgi:predicted transposase YdaD
MTLQARQNESRLFREVAMNLSPVYDEWREKTLAEGREQGISLGREQGISLGREQGISLGREQGQVGLVKQLLAVKFTQISDRTLAQIDRLPSEKLTELAIALLSFERVGDLEGWLVEHGVG